MHMNDKRRVVTKAASRAAEFCVKSALGTAGVILFVLGVYGVCKDIASSYMFYASLGLFFSLSYSAWFRTMFLDKTMPKSWIVYLHDKSVVDIVVEISGLVQVLIALAASAIVGENDLRRLMDALPQEYDFVRRPGLIYFLPPALQKMLIKDTEKKEDENENEDEGGIGDGLFFSIPVSRSIPSRTPTQIANVTALDNSIDHSRFVEHAIALGVKNLNSFVSQLQVFCISGARYIFNGANFTDNQLAGAAVGLGVCTTVCSLLSIKRSGETIPRSVGRISKMITNTASPILGLLATTAGSMLVIRHLDEYEKWKIFSPLLITLQFANKKLVHFYRQIKGYDHNATQMAVIMTSLVLLFCWRMKSQITQMKFLMAVIYRKLLDNFV